MTHFENQLWSKILNFEFDAPETKLTFKTRLARENGWTSIYTKRVIDEYKKFIFLCCTSAEPITPSDPVDQAWHLHLTYTKSYWQNLCRDTLGMEIHHNPTKGGKSEQQKFSISYKKLYELYTEKFNSQPPTDIWHDEKIRFSDIDFVRTNKAKYWIVRKPSAKIRSLIMQLFITALAMLFIQASDSFGFLIIFITIILFNIFRKKGNGNGNENGCSSFSCSSDSSCSSDGGDSGCSGCGGGCGGGD
ncbi:hypothetical protein [Flavobacterium sp. Sd200]|uniref:glycine-rich domain-containing protein n=1 Tax=Flavobacterium sp. Sd200 TaxID=2692211 RepID=UPI0019274AFC|nr:hypothetical protein [Flavobacterium sp. Sd200]